MEELPKNTPGPSRHQKWNPYVTSALAVILQHMEQAIKLSGEATKEPWENRENATLIDAYRNQHPSAARMILAMLTGLGSCVCVDEVGESPCHKCASLIELAEALEGLTVSDWQPIETAPKDGSRVLLVSIPDEFPGPDGPIVRGPNVHIGCWNGEGDAWVDECDSFDGDAHHLAKTGNWSVGSGWLQPNEVSHWMPIPAPPSSVKEEKK